MTKQTDASFDRNQNAFMDALYWQGIATLFRAPHNANPNECDIALVGVPLTHMNDNGISIQHITDYYAQIDAAGTRPVSVVGDHSITGGILQAL